LTAAVITGSLDGSGLKDLTKFSSVQKPLLEIARDRIQKYLDEVRNAENILTAPVSSPTEWAPDYVVIDEDADMSSKDKLIRELLWLEESFRIKSITTSDILKNLDSCFVRWLTKYKPNQAITVAVDYLHPSEVSVQFAILGSYAPEKHLFTYNKDGISDIAEFLNLL